MKNNYKLYEAMGNIDDKIIRETEAYQAQKKDRSRLFTALEAVAVVAVVCGFVVLSVVLTKVSGPKTDPASSGEESAIQTDTETTTAADKAAEKKKNGHTFLESPVKDVKAEELYRMEPYKNFLPAEIPDNYVELFSYRYVPGNYLCDDGTYQKVSEHGGVSFRDSTVNNENDEIQLDVVVYENEGRPVTENLSVSDVSCGVFHGVRNGGPMLAGIEYKLCWVSDDGWYILYQFRIYPEAINTLTAKDLYDLAITAPYFKDHPIAKDDTSLNKIASLTSDYDGLTLSVDIETQGSNVTFGSLLDVTATLKNTTDNDVTIVVPVSSPAKESHQEIQVSLVKKDNENIRFKDLDTYGVCFETAESYLTLKPGEEYVQKMRLTGDENLIQETEQSPFDEFGTFICRAEFRKLSDVNDNSKSDECVLEFEIVFE